MTDLLAARRRRSSATPCSSPSRRSIRATPTSPSCSTWPYQSAAPQLQPIRQRAPSAARSRAVHDLAAGSGTGAEHRPQARRELRARRQRACRMMFELARAAGQARTSRCPIRPGPTDALAIEPAKSAATGRRWPARRADYPIEPIGKAAAALGHLNATPDVDGGTRTEPLVVAYYARYFPSLSMMIAAKSLNLGVADIKVSAGEKVSLATLSITTDPLTQMYTYFYKDRDGRPAFPVDSFYDVYTGKIPVDKVPRQDRADRPHRGRPGHRHGHAGLARHAAGADARALGVVDPVGAFLRRAGLGLLGRAAAVSCSVAAYLIALLPRLKAGRRWRSPAASSSRCWSAHFVLMTANGMWLQLMLPATLLARRPRRARHQALHRHRARRRSSRTRPRRRVEPHARASPTRRRASSTWPGTSSARCRSPTR